MNTSVFILGVVVGILGFFAYGYTIYETNTYFFGAFTQIEGVRPYVNFATPLFVFAVLLIVLGAILPSRITTKVTEVHDNERPKHRTRTIVTEEE